MLTRVSLAFTGNFCYFFLVTDCLRVEMPKRNRVAALRPKKPKAQDRDTKSGLHEEL